jgi:hypothetical protein
MLQALVKDESCAEKHFWIVDVLQQMLHSMILAVRHHHSRFVRLQISENTDAGVNISASKFGEFVAATNYYTKFRDNLETLQTGKRKIFEYLFGDDSKFVMMGDKNNVAMELSDKKEKAIIFSTKDLRIINSFSDNINSAQKFLASHKFEECL